MLYAIARRLTLTLAVLGALLLWASHTISAAAQSVFINELHYDNTGTDADEGVEIAGPTGTDLTGWTVVLYNGTGGATYGTINLAGALPNNGQSCGTLNFGLAANGLQNGSPDGLALVSPANVVIQFLSYEGSFVAVGGPANGLTSTDIGVTEAGTEPLGQSLQLQGTGFQYSQFTWAGPINHTRGATNTGQTLNCLPTPTPTATTIPPPQFLAQDAALQVTEPFECTAPGDTLEVEFAFLNSGVGNATGARVGVQLPPGLVGVPGSCSFTGGSSGDCTLAEGGLIWIGNIPGTPAAPANLLTVNFKVRVRGGTHVGTTLCVPVKLEFDENQDGSLDSELALEDCITVDCLPTVDPNRQLGCQIHLPILNFLGQDDVCASMIEVQLLGCDPAKAVLVTWGAPGFCPPQAAGPLKVECTGLLVPGASWILMGAQVPTGSKSGMLFKFSARQLSELGVTDLGFDDVAADLMCETLFFGIVGDADDYRRFKKAYNEGLTFAGLNQAQVMGDGFLAAEVMRECPGNETPGTVVTSKYNGLAGSHLGDYDPVFGGFGYYAPLVQAARSGFETVLYIQNGGLECSSVEIWFKAQDDCLRATICDISTLAPGETYQFDASDCVGPDWQGSAWIRSSEPMGVVVDIVGRDVLMTYFGEPAELDFSFDLQHPYASDGNLVAFGPLVYSEYQGWDTGLQIMNMSGRTAAKVKVYFLDRSGDVVTTLVDWICPRGSQSFFLPMIYNLPGNWVGSVRAESQTWWTPGAPQVDAPRIVGVVQMIQYGDVARSAPLEALAYNLLPEHKAFDWQVGANGGGLESGVGLIAIPSLLKDLGRVGVTSELAVANLVTKPGFTDFAVYIFDQNGLLDYVCQKLADRQVEYMDLQTWGYLGTGFKGSAIISATHWEHEVFDPEGFFLRSLVGLGAVSVERSGTRLGEDVPGDEAAGDRGIPFTNDPARDEPFAYCFAGPAVAFCPGQPGERATCPEKIIAVGTPGDIPDDRAGAAVFQDNLTVNFPAVPGQCVVDDVNLQLTIQHDVLQDLDVHLEHLDLRSEMFTDICGFAVDLDVVLDDDAAAAIQSNCPPNDGGRYTTEDGGGLNAFEGLDAKGVWKLIIDDDFQSGVGIGKVTRWQLELRTKAR
ncbi:MAG: hypothetical protein IPJ58_06585 [Ardenticatenia bacterium]|nr:hypothetical protein [Ardenticatenia bacterium]